jgi:hypothetical protein
MSSGEVLEIGPVISHSHVTDYVPMRLPKELPHMLDWVRSRQWLRRTTEDRRMHLHCEIYNRWEETLYPNQIPPLNNPAVELRKQYKKLWEDVGKEAETKRGEEILWKDSASFWAINSTPESFSLRVSSRKFLMGFAFDLDDPNDSM